MNDRGECRQSQQHCLTSASIAPLRLIFSIGWNAEEAPVRRTTIVSYLTNTIGCFGFTVERYRRRLDNQWKGSGMSRIVTRRPWEGVEKVVVMQLWNGRGWHRCPSRRMHATKEIIVQAQVPAWLTDALVQLYSTETESDSSCCTAVQERRPILLCSGDLPSFVKYLNATVAFFHVFMSTYCPLWPKRLIIKHTTTEKSHTAFQN